MNHKKIGYVFVFLSVLLFIILIFVITNLQSKAEELHCYPSSECISVERGLSFSHFVVGVISFVFSLGFYFLFFTDKNQDSLLKALEKQHLTQDLDVKFSYILRGLDHFEQQVMKLIKEQEGITQNTLRIKSDLSKSKLSQVLTQLEKKELITRVTKGKTFALYLKIPL
mgnify:CR=1 FL=1